ncbi:MAG TPA: hypothetical protein ENI27_09390, partial [bacterium]|nr:hypothetical protein [bacterium]
MVFPNGSSITVDAIIAASASGLKLYDDGGNGIFVKDGRHVGIGTDSPDELLHLAQDGADDSNAAFGQLAISGVTDQTKRLLIGYDTTNDHGFLQAADEATAFKNMEYGGSRHIFRTTAGTERMRISPGGNVGIGTNSPEAKLHVKGVIHVADPALTRYFIEVFSSGGVGFIDSYDSTGNDYQDLVVRADDFIFEGQG